MGIVLLLSLMNRFDATRVVPDRHRYRVEIRFTTSISPPVPVFEGREWSISYKFES